MREIVNKYGMSSPEHSRIKKQRENKGCLFKLDYWQNELLLRAGNIEYALGNTTKACEYWNDGYKLDKNYMWANRNFFFTYGPNNLAKFNLQSSSYELTFINNKYFQENYKNEWKFLTDIHKKYPTYFKRAAEINDFGDIDEIIYEKCLD